MDTSLTIAGTRALESLPPPSPPSELQARSDDPELREAFDAFVGEVFYGQMLSAMRKTLGKPAYFHGGRGEEVFRNQLDQALTQEMSRAGANSFTDRMFEQFQLSSLSRG